MPVRLTCVVSGTVKSIRSRTAPPTCVWTAVVSGTVKSIARRRPPTVADGERAEGADARCAVEVDDEAAGHGIARLRRHLMADPLALVQLYAVLRAPGAGDDVEVLLLWRIGGHHVVDEEGEAFRLGHALDAELLLHLLEDEVEIAGEVVAQHIVVLDLDLRAGPHRHARPARTPRIFSAIV